MYYIQAKMRRMSMNIKESSNKCNPHTDPVASPVKLRRHKRLTCCLTCGVVQSPGKGV